MSAVRRFAAVRVFGRDPARRREFAARATREVGVAAAAVDTARDAVEGVDVVILATNSAEPVVSTDWLTSAVHVSTVGPKQHDRAEFDERLLDAAAMDAVDADTADALLLRYVNANAHTIATPSDVAEAFAPAPDVLAVLREYGAID